MDDDDGRTDSILLTQSFLWTWTYPVLSPVVCVIVYSETTHLRMIDRSIDLCVCVCNYVV
jgi:hypothetical protein